MRKRFLDFIEKHALTGPSERVLLAVSGGLDSMAMLHLFRQTDIPIAVAHCNFSLRDQESDGDEQFVKDQAEALGITCFLTKFDTKAFASEHKLSTQMAARQLRYDWFNQLCEAECFDKVATAHHLNDSFETVLFNLAKGTSIAGLRGILPLRDRVIRPLLDFSREELEGFMKEQGHPWREDSSNQDTYYQRNFIRSEVVEPLKKVNPDLLMTFKETSARNREVEEVFRNAMTTLKSTAIRAEEGHHRVSLEQVSGPYVLEQLISDFGFGYKQAKEIWDVREGLSGSTFHSASHSLVVNRGDLVITSQEDKPAVEILLKAEAGEVMLGEHTYQAKLQSIDELPHNWKQSAHAVLDLEQLQFPLTVRSWRQGDYFFPLGMKGKKKLSDFMIDQKIPLNLKNRLRVLESDGQIAWVVGLRVDDRFKVTPKTRQIFCLIDQHADV